MKLGQLEQFSTLQANVQSMTDSLTDQINTLGKTEEQIKNLKLNEMFQQAEQFKLISPEQLEALRVAIGRTKELNAQLAEQKRWDAKMARRATLKEEFGKEVEGKLQNSPVEQFKRYRAQVEKWMGAGLAKKQAMALLEGKMGDLMGPKEKKKLQAGEFVDKGSQWKTIQSRILQKEDIPAKQLKAQEDLKKAMEDIRDKGLVIRGG